MAAGTPSVNRNDEGNTPAADRYAALNATRLARRTDAMRSTARRHRT